MATKKKKTFFEALVAGGTKKNTVFCGFPLENNNCDISGVGDAPGGLHAGQANLRGHVCPRSVHRYTGTLEFNPFTLDAPPPLLWFFLPFNKKI